MFTISVFYCTHILVRNIYELVIIHITSNCFEACDKWDMLLRGQWTLQSQTPWIHFETDLIKLYSINNWPTFISHNYSHHLIVLCQWSLTDPSGSLDGFDGTFQPLLRMRSLPLLQFQVRRAAQHCWRRQKIMACIDATENRQGNLLLCFDVLKKLGH